MNPRKIYFASPLGFSPELKPYLDKVEAKLISLGCEVWNPWKQSNGVEQLIAAAYETDSVTTRKEAFAAIAYQLGAANTIGINQADAVFAVLDGTEPDSGTVAELGYAAGKGKQCYGLRTDFRDCGDFFGVPLNLQLLFFIHLSGGKLFRSMDEISF